MRWLDKKTRIKRNKLIMELRAQGLTFKQISAQTNLAPRGVEEVFYIERKRRQENDH